MDSSKGLLSPRLLLTGFEPFAHYPINPSWIAAQQVEEAFPLQVVARCLPVHHLRARERLMQVLDEVKPRAVLAMGLAAGDEFRIECTARKALEFADLAGAAQHRITLDRELLAKTLQRQAAPWRYSEDAGRYVCESTYWALLEYAGRLKSPLPCAFLHVPADSILWPAQRTADVVLDIVGDMLKAIEALGRRG